MRSAIPVTEKPKKKKKDRFVHSKKSQKEKQNGTKYDMFHRSFPSFLEQSAACCRLLGKTVWETCCFSRSSLSQLQTFYHLFFLCVIFSPMSSHMECCPGQTGFRLPHNRRQRGSKDAQNRFLGRPAAGPKEM